MTQENLTEYLYEQIPLSKAMGIKIQHASLQNVIIAAPLAPNINHKKYVAFKMLRQLVHLGGYVWALVPLWGLRSSTATGVPCYGSLYILGLRMGACTSLGATI